MLVAMIRWLGQFAWVRRAAGWLVKTMQEPCARPPLGEHGRVLVEPVKQASEVTPSQAWCQTITLNGWRDVEWEEIDFGYMNRVKIKVTATHPVTGSRVRRELTFNPMGALGSRRLAFLARERVRNSLGTPERFTAGNEPLTLELTEVS